MAKSQKVKASPAQLLVLGLDETGRPRGARFPSHYAAEVKKAAREMGMAVVAIEDEIAEAARKIPMGKVSDSGEIKVGAVHTKIFNKVVGLVGLDLPGSQAEPIEETVGPWKLPASWETISKGDMVLAPASAEVGGFWQAHVLDREGDLLTLMWGGDWVGAPKFTRRISSVGLMYPEAPQADAGTAQADETTAE